MLVQTILLLSCLHETIGVQPRGRLGEEARTPTVAQRRQLRMSVCVCACVCVRAFVPVGAIAF